VTSSRLADGGVWIDRSKPVGFTFDGTELEGFEGDTLASALLANGVVGGFRSPILGRARGVHAAGVEEPNAYAEISAPWFDPIAAATTVPLVDGLVAFPRIRVRWRRRGSRTGACTSSCWSSAAARRGVRPPVRPPRRETACSWSTSTPSSTRRRRVRT
jgi:hypothetical protein